jgi:hypothetical protein
MILAYIRSNVELTKSEIRIGPSGSAETFSLDANVVGNETTHTLALRVANVSAALDKEVNFHVESAALVSLYLSKSSNL